jgi:hypothetical protein
VINDFLVRCAQFCYLIHKKDYALLVSILVPMLCVCSNARSIFSYTMQYVLLVLQYVELLLCGCQFFICSYALLALNCIPNCSLVLYFSVICSRMKQSFSPCLMILFSYTGEAHSLKVEKILYQGKSPYQEVLVFEVLI